MRESFEIVWSGAGGQFSLSSANNAPTTAARAVLAADDDPPPRRKPTRGYRPPGFRLRDAVFACVPAPGAVISLRQVAEQMEADERELANLARALGQLVREGRLRRARDRTSKRWLYWRV